MIFNKENWKEREGFDGAESTRYKDIVEESMDLQYMSEVQALSEELDIEAEFEYCLGEIFI